MTYSESAEGVTIDRARGVRELARHGRTVASLEPFELAEFEALFASGACDAGDLLRWLGY
jgi:hypothetical protein